MRILVITKEPPWPLFYGGRLRCYELCKRLAKRHELLMLAQQNSEDHNWSFNFECRLINDNQLQPLSGKADGKDLQLTRAEQFFGINTNFTRNVIQLADEWQPDLVMGMNFQSLAHVARINNIPTICDLVDDGTLFALLELMKGCDKGKIAAMKCLMASAFYQIQNTPKVGAITVTSQTDQKFCKWHTRHRRVAAIPNGTDCEYYAPQNEEVDLNRIVFWGSLNFGPNLSAILYFADQVWPLVKKRKPHLHWTIIGKDCSPRLERIKDLPGVDLIGYTDDIRPHVASAAAVVVPMLTGAGIKNKILEGWAMGKAILCTPRALGDLPGTHGGNVWLAQKPRQLADGLLTLINRPELRRQIEQEARQTALEKCSWDRAAEQLEQLCVELVTPKESPLFNVAIPEPDHKNSLNTTQLS